MSEKLTEEAMKEPLLSFTFGIQCDGLANSGEMEIAGFNEVSGLTRETTVETFQEGGRNDRDVALAGPSKNPERLTLKRGLSSTELWDWHQQVVSGQIVRRNVSVLLLNSRKEACAKWEFADACPVKWVGPRFNASRGEVAFESIEFIFRTLKQGSV